MEIGYSKKDAFLRKNYKTICWSLNFLKYDFKKSKKISLKINDQKKDKYG